MLTFFILADFIVLKTSYVYRCGRAAAAAPAAAGKVAETRGYFGLTRTE